MASHSALNDANHVTATPSQEIVRITAFGSRRSGMYQSYWVRKDQLHKYTTFLKWHHLPATIREDPRTFNVFAIWLYGQRVEDLDLDMTELVNAWLLGMKYRAINFQNIVMMELLRKHRHGAQVLPTHVTKAYGKTRPESPLRFVVVDLYRDLPEKEKQSDRWRCFRGYCDVDFLADVSGEGRMEEGASAIKRSKEYWV